MDNAYTEPRSKRFKRLAPLFAKKGGSKTPKAPDYTAAAKATSEGNLEAARAAAAANRVSQYTPYGSMEYSHTGSDPDNGWTSTVTLSPAEQANLNSQNALAGSLYGQAGESLNTPFKYGDLQSIQDDAYNTYKARLDPQWQQNQQEMDAKLANQGIMPGSAAYEDSYRTFNQGKNDAYQQATTAAISQMPQAYQLAAALRDQPLNELNALRGGSQVTNPAFTNAPQQATTSGTDYLGAANLGYNSQLDAYNAKSGNKNALMGGLFNLGSSALEGGLFG